MLMMVMMIFDQNDGDDGDDEEDDGSYLPTLMIARAMIMVFLLSIALSVVLLLFLV